MEKNNLSGTVHNLLLTVYLVSLCFANAQRLKSFNFQSTVLTAPHGHFFQGTYSLFNLSIFTFLFLSCRYTHNLDKTGTKKF